MQRRAPQVVLLVMVLLFLTGCGGDAIFPITTGSHTTHNSGNNGVYIVWSNQLGR